MPGTPRGLTIAIAGLNLALFAASTALHAVTASKDPGAYVRSASYTLLVRRDDAINGG